MDARADLHSDTCSYVDAGAAAVTDSYGRAQAYGDRHAHCYSYGNAHANRHCRTYAGAAYAYSVAHCYRHGDCHANINTYTHADSESDADRNAYTYAQSYTSAYIYTVADSAAYEEASDCHAYTYTSAANQHWPVASRSRA